MASTLPEGALEKIAESVKSLVIPNEDAETSSHVQKTSRTSAGVETKSHTEQILHMEEAAPVEHETVKRFEHEVRETIINKDIHQDHYHRTIQPIKERVVLPTKHIYIEAGSEREFDHRDKTPAEGAQQDAQGYPVEGRLQQHGHAEVNRTQENGQAECYVEETVRHVVTNETIIPPPVETVHHYHKTRHLAPGQESAYTPTKSGLGGPQDTVKSSKGVGTREAH
ncbi:hypothetical protein E8E14_005228 [Neopestalotiopsis sp. 37M]|nr:hypothetical protein E8E14_005228 [Neopestalotiopsis sp. 37M]